MADPSRTALLCDLDGTLAELVADPADAAPLPGAGAVLDYLAHHLHTVAVVSGRPLAFLEDALRPTASGVLLAGLYGLERSVTDRPSGGAGHPEGPDGAGRSEAADAEAWRAVVTAAVAEAAGGLPAGARLEDKGLALAFHYREAPDTEAAVVALATRIATRHGLIEKPAKLAVELVPPVAVDKGTVATELAEGCAVACALGDDSGDLAAFAALNRLVDEGRLGGAVCAAIAGAETPADLLDAADLVLDGPAAALGFLEELAERLGYTRPDTG